MVDYIIDRRDLEFLLYEQFDLVGLTKLSPYQEMSRADFDAVLDASQKLAKEVLGPISAVADREGCRFENGEVHVPEAFSDAFKQFAEGGWIAKNRPPELGGMGLPIPLSIAAVEMEIGSSSAFVFYTGLTVAAGHLLESFADPWLRDLTVPKLYGGEWTGTMCLTEPQAGTAVGDLRSSARPIDGKRYAIRGDKIFISAGDHQLTKNILHLVLARVEGDPAGTKGISLFAVPKYRFDEQGDIIGPNDVVTTAVEHKMGIHGSATCALAFGDNGGCEGWLIGERCNGLHYMFQMMNEARIVTGVQGVAMANYAYQLALAYARQRVQGAKLTDRSAAQKAVNIIEHPDVRRNLMLCKAHGEGIRALLMQAAFFHDLAEHHPDAQARVKYQDLLDLLTPICKAYASDTGFEVTELAMQVHGGYGYIKEYGVEQLMRDVKIASIYEGTNGVQALDLLGRKMRMKDGGLFLTWLQDTNELLQAQANHPRLSAETAALDKAKNTLAEVAFNFAAQGASDPELALLGATPFLEMFGQVEVGRLLLQQALIADAALAKRGLTEPAEIAARAAEDAEVRFYDGKVKTARFYVANVLPHVQATARAIKAGDRSALDIVF